MAGRIYASLGQASQAKALADGLSKELQIESQVYGQLIEGEIALQSKDARAAIKLFSDSNTLLDTWIGRFSLGRAYVEAGAFVEADSEFDRCIKRRGEALSLLVDEEPTYGYFPTVYYYQGLVREGLKNPAFAQSYGEYLTIRGRSTEDPILSDVRRRAARN